MYILINTDEFTQMETNQISGLQMGSLSLILAEVNMTLFFFLGMSMTFSALAWIHAGN